MIGWDLGGGFTQTEEYMTRFIDCLGHLYGTYGDYHGTFYFAGSVVFIAGAICYPLACVNRKPSEGTQSL